MLTATQQSARKSRPHSVSKTPVELTYISSFRTELNWMAVAWRDDRLVANVFGYPSRRLADLALGRIPGMPQSFCRVPADGQADELPSWTSSLIARLQLFAAGENIDFADVPLSLGHLTTFGARVIAECRRIQWGNTTSYGELAAKCGSPGAPRAVGSVMAKNRYPLIVPCHRVLTAGGDIGGYSAPEGLTMKRRLLRMEGSLL
jgi:methylated-DNA-[protein]-cysteine S-methyltransferase